MYNTSTIEHGLINHPLKCCAYFWSLALKELEFKPKQVEDESGIWAASHDSD